MFVLKGTCSKNYAQSLLWYELLWLHAKWFTHLHRGYCTESVAVSIDVWQFSASWNIISKAILWVTVIPFNSFYYTMLSTPIQEYIDLWLHCKIMTNTVSPSRCRAIMHWITSERKPWWELFVIMNVMSGCLIYLCYYIAFIIILYFIRLSDSVRLLGLIGAIFHLYRACLMHAAPYICNHFKCGNGLGEFLSLP